MNDNPANAASDQQPEKGRIASDYVYQVAAIVAALLLILSAAA
jgi:hypothetical protein